MFPWRFATGFTLLTAGFTLLTAGCQGEYPLAPTICDEWCHVTKGFSCGFYDPAACVSECEAQLFASGDACRAPVEVALACFRNTPGALVRYCARGEMQPCLKELEALYSCVNALPQRG